MLVPLAVPLAFSLCFKLVSILAKEGRSVFSEFGLFAKYKFSESEQLIMFLSKGLIILLLLFAFYADSFGLTHFITGCFFVALDAFTAFDIYCSGLYYLNAGPYVPISLPLISLFVMFMYFYAILWAFKYFGIVAIKHFKRVNFIDVEDTID